jgi:hypothetical protein
MYFSLHEKNAYSKSDISESIQEDLRQLGLSWFSGMAAGQLNHHELKKSLQ